MMAKGQHDLQQQISNCGSRVKIYIEILHEDIVLSSLEHELFRLDGAIESSEERAKHFASTQRQPCEIDNVEFQVIQIANAELKDIEDKHKDIVRI
jgi:hypothetical protein